MTVRAREWKLSISSTPPTTQIQKFRGHTLDILGVLSEFGGLTTREIADRTGLSNKLVYEYCRRGFNRGIFGRKEAWGWCVTPLGLLVISITTTTTNHTTTTQPPHNHHTTTTQEQVRSQRQLNLSTFTDREDITEPERVVVEELAGHYEHSGEKYRYFLDEYELADEMHISISEVRPALAHLKEQGCIYVRKEALGWKIGLKKAFVERLSYR